MKTYITNKNITFDVSTHTYFYNGIKVPSVSTIISGKEELNIAPYYQIVGKVLHNAIEQWIKTKNNNFDKKINCNINDYIITPLRDMFLSDLRIEKHNANDNVLVEFKKSVETLNLELENEAKEITNKAWECFKKFLTWFKEFFKDKEVEIYAYEWVIGNHRVCGTIDCLMKVNGEFYLFDWKSGKTTAKQKPTKKEPDLIKHTLIPNQKHKLQMGGYKYLLKNENIELKEINIVYLGDNYGENKVEIVLVEPHWYFNFLTKLKQYENAYADFHGHCREINLEQELKDEVDWEAHKERMGVK